MGRKRWFYVPVLLVVVGSPGALIWAQRKRDPQGRIAHESFFRIEAELGRHLYAPTWLPPGGRVGPLGARRGKHRILQDFCNERGEALFFLAQEARSPERDDYHRRLFAERAEARAAVGERPAYFVTGNSGERRLFWNEKDAAVILSSSVMTDQEMLEVAGLVR
jgi:hypothetical protein